jgi:hypothetical protein
MHSSALIPSSIGGKVQLCYEVVSRVRRNEERKGERRKIFDEREYLHWDGL